MNVDFVSEHNSLHLIITNSWTACSQLTYTNCLSCEAGNSTSSYKCLSCNSGYTVKDDNSECTGKGNVLTTSFASTKRVRSRVPILDLSYPHWLGGWHTPPPTPPPTPTLTCKPYTRSVQYLDQLLQLYGQ